MNIEFGKGDIRRTLLVLAMIADKQPITLNQLVDELNMPKGTVQEQLKKLVAGQLPGVEIIKNGSAYQVESTGELINLLKVRKWYRAIQKDC